MKTIGKLLEITRYPVKSFAGERMQACGIESYGMQGDRIAAFVDETREGWNSFITARTIPVMLNYQARLGGDGQADRLRIISPDGRSLLWDEQLREEIQQHSTQPVSLKSYAEPIDGLMAVDAASLLIVTTASLLKLETRWDKAIDSRRFRPNLLIELDDTLLQEGELIGRSIAIGGAELQINEYCERCSMITIEPGTLERDKSLLAAVNEHFELHFGLYASVRRPGGVQAGDEIRLLHT
ncbi:MOSC domain-containing protein [Paenibacillus sp. R14(2021)]|uniref:MOSC domain-containing protein n=1 Tax=Paenibacillus sp. R14(2021) TaxID=2859228 RepID=UPI001C6166BC|nr:MOSC domain-containing protein [Paenibacillus sp. R14(2021)]